MSSYAFLSVAKVDALDVLGFSTAWDRGARRLGVTRGGDC